MKSHAILILNLVLLVSPVFSEEDSVNRDYAAELPRIAPQPPEDALKSFRVHPDFEMQLIAAEPLVRDPIAMAFDEDGRMYVVEMTGYSEQRDTVPGTVRLLEDGDGDGIYEKATPFLEGLPWAVAVACWEGGVFVGVPPDIIYAKDMNGDGIADTKTIAFTGFGLSNVQGMMNTFLWTLDNRIHGATSSSGGKVRRADAPETTAINLNGRDFSFDPRTRDIRPESGGAQHGVTFDDYGNKFVCSNSDHLQWVWYEERFAAVHPWYAPPPPRESIAVDGPAAEVFRISPVEPWRELRTRLRVKGLVPGPIEGGGRAAGYFTSATGVTVYRGDAWPASFRGQVFIGDVGGNLIHRKQLNYDPRRGFIGERMDAGTEFVASSDIWFRPVQFANAPDGCLYVADMYREVIEHPDSLPPVIKKHLDLSSGNDRGRIYRIAPKGFVARKVPALSSLDTPALVALLEHDNAWHRETAARLIYERQDLGAVLPLETLVVSSPHILARIHALYALHGLHALRPELLAQAARDVHPAVRAHTARLAAAFPDNATIQSFMLSLSEDADTQVRASAAWSLSVFPEPVRVSVLARIARHDLENMHLRAAILSSAGEFAGQLIYSLASDGLPLREDAHAGLESLARIAAASENAASIAAVLRSIEELQVTDHTTADALLRGLLAGGLKMDEGTSSPAAARLARLISDSLEQAQNNLLEPSLRARAVATLAFAPPDRNNDVLAGLLTPQTPEEVQAATIEVLSGRQPSEAARILLDAWPSLGPGLRAKATEILFRRVGTLKLLLAAMEAGRIRPGDLDAVRKRALLQHPDAEVQAAAKRLLGEARVSDRAAVVEAYKPSLELPGDAERGAAIFAANCTPCHRIRDQGHDVGPSLATVAQAGAEKILANVLDPNAELNPQYVNYTIETNDFETHTGIIVAESANSITLKRAYGETETIPRASIEKIRSESLSIMPEGLESAISVQQMADLIAYITSSN